jgi:hypothetical protein
MLDITHFSKLNRRSESVLVVGMSYLLAATHKTDIQITWLDRHTYNAMTLSDDHAFYVESFSRESTSYIIYYQP